MYDKKYQFANNLIAVCYALLQHVKYSFFLQIKKTFLYLQSQTR